MRKTSSQQGGKSRTPAVLRDGQLALWGQRSQARPVAWGSTRVHVVGGFLPAAAGSRIRLLRGSLIETMGELEDSPGSGSGDGDKNELGPTSEFSRPTSQEGKRTGSGGKGSCQRHQGPDRWGMGRAEDHTLKQFIHLKGGLAGEAMWRDRGAYSSAGTGPEGTAHRAAADHRGQQ